MSKKGLFVTLLLLMLVIAGCSSGASGSTEDNSKDTNKSEKSPNGGELKIALNMQPETIDTHMVTATATRDTGRLIFEKLMTTNSNNEVVPELAESVDISDDSKVYTFHLRKGVKFHNGKEMTSEDVIASMNRWVEYSRTGNSFFAGASFIAEDEYTVVLELAQSSALALDLLASEKQAASIMPKEVIDEAPAEGVNDYVGTGPFKFVEWKQDQYIHFSKNEDYQPLEKEADGLSGKKEALVDDIYFYIVTDPSTRLAGLKSGEYHFAYNISNDDYDQLESDSNLEPVVSSDASKLVYLYNKKEGPASNFKLRQAINAALDMDSIMKAVFSNEKFYKMSSGYMPTNSSWASDAGNEVYNQADQEKAKKLLEEAGYDGEEFRLLATRDYPEYYDAAVVIQEQLNQIGVNVKLEVYDWATFNERLNDSGNWDSLVVGISAVDTPLQIVTLSPDFAGGIGDSKVTDILKSIENEVDYDEAVQKWDELQGYLWEEHIPESQLGEYYGLFGASNKVEGLTMPRGPIFWNTIVSE